MSLTDHNAKWWQFIAYAAFVGILTGCISAGSPVAPTATLEPSLVDRSLLTDSPCAAPCWYGLEPGQSTKEQVLAMAQTLPFIDPSDFPQEPSYYRDPSTGTYVVGTLLRLKWRRPGDGTYVSLLMVDDVLKQTHLTPPPSLTFGEVVAHLGPPDFVRRYPVPIRQSSCNLALIWKKRAIWVAFLNGPPKTDQVRCADVGGGRGVDPDLPVGQVVYSTPDDYAIASVDPSGDFPWPGFAKP